MGCTRAESSSNRVLVYTEHLIAMELSVRDDLHVIGHNIDTVMTGIPGRQIYHCCCVAPDARNGNECNGGDNNNNNHSCYPAFNSCSSPSLELGIQVN